MPCSRAWLALFVASTVCMGARAAARRFAARSPSDHAGLVALQPGLGLRWAEVKHRILLVIALSLFACGTTAPPAALHPAARLGPTEASASASSPPDPTPPGPVPSVAANGPAAAEAPTAGKTGRSGGGRGLSCVGLITDVGPLACTDQTFCHRLSLANLTVSVVSLVSKDPISREGILEHYHPLNGPLHGSRNPLRDCFSHQVSDARSLTASVRIQLAGDLGECPDDDAIRIVKRSSAPATAKCVRDTFKRWIFPPGSGRARFQLDVSLEALPE